MFETLQALAEPTRFAILQMVRRNEMAAGAIAGKFKGITRPAVSQHLRVLKDAGLITERREGTRRLYSLRREGFAPLRALLEDFWDSKLERLKAVAENKEKRSHERNL